MVECEQKANLNLEQILSKAIKMHGHLGPFLVIGVKMGLLAERLLGEKARGCEFKTINKIPYLCTVDGIKSVVGENAVIVKEGNGISAMFHGTYGKKVVLKIKKSIIEKYVNVPWEQCEESAHEILQEDEENLLDILS